jgi:hypothetical protein
MTPNREWIRTRFQKALRIGISPFSLAMIPMIYPAKHPKGCVPKGKGRLEQEQGKDVQRPGISAKGEDWPSDSPGGAHSRLDNAPCSRFKKGLR